MMKPKKQKQWPDLDVSDECERLAGIYIYTEAALGITHRLKSDAYPSVKAVNRDIDLLEDLLQRIKKHAYDDGQDVKVGGTD